MSEKLRSCPFCGAELYRLQVEDPLAVCRTPECFGASMPLVVLDHQPSVDAWNRRAPLPQPNVAGLSEDTRELLMAVENVARMAEQGVLSADGGQAAVEIRSLVPMRFRAVTEGSAK